MWTIVAFCACFYTLYPLHVLSIWSFLNYKHTFWGLMHFNSLCFVAPHCYILGHSCHAIFIGRLMNDKPAWSQGNSYILRVSQFVWIRTNDLHLTPPQNLPSLGTRHIIQNLTSEVVQIRTKYIRIGCEIELDKLLLVHNPPTLSRRLPGNQTSLCFGLERVGVSITLLGQRNPILIITYSCPL